MREWIDATLKLDKYLSLKCDVLIATSISFDMIFGLNSYLAIGGTLT